MPYPYEPTWVLVAEGFQPPPGVGASPWTWASENPLGFKKNCIIVKFYKIVFEYYIAYQGKSLCDCKVGVYYLCKMMCDFIKVFYGFNMKCNHASLLIEAP